MGDGRSEESDRPKPKRAGWLKESGLDITPGQFWLASLGAGFGTYAVVFALTSLPIVSLMPSVVVATLPKAYFSRKRAQRLDDVQRAWPDGLRDLLASVRSGASLPTAIEGLASFGPAPLQVAFQGFPVYSHSLGVVPALEMIKSDLADPTSDRVIEVLILAYERGGTVVPEILSDLADATTKDLWTLEEIRTDALEQKINSRIVFILPWLVLVAMTARAGPFPRVLRVTDGRAGCRHRRGDELGRSGHRLETRSSAGTSPGCSCRRGGWGLTLTPVVLAAAGSTALAAGLVLYALFPPARSLASRIVPYLSPSGRRPAAPRAAGRSPWCSGPCFARLRHRWDECWRDPGRT